MKVLVTGAAGRLGSLVCKRLVAEGHRVLATDRRFADGLDAPFSLADLRDERALYPLLEGQDALVHLGNIPSLNRGPSAQAVLSDNVAMNANAFRAAVEQGAKRIVFASSLQVMIRLDDGQQTEPPYTVPYLPLDGRAPANPGHNLYGLSKEVGERLLHLLCERDPALACTSLRFPMLVGASFLERAGQSLPESALNFGEGLTYLELTDAAELVGLVLARQAPGYHQYFPARALELAGHGAAAVAARFFPQTPLRRPLEGLESLVDLGDLEADLGFLPRPPLTVRLAGS